MVLAACRNASASRSWRCIRRDIMTGASTLDPDNLPDTSTITPRGNDTGSLGPSDTSDSGSDIASGGVVSPEELGSDSDAAGTGDRAGPGETDDAGEDIGFDSVVDAEDAGLGTGLDEAELAQRQP
jgi:hypothetical protein